MGAGAGPAGLITADGARWLGRADVVAYDRLVDPALLATAGEAELIYVGKKPGQSVSQDRITALLISKAREGKLVVRLKGGDAFIFGRGGEEADALAEAGVPFRVVPGITAAVAAGTYAGIPLTDRRRASSVAFVTGHEDPVKETSSMNWASLAGVDTLVCYMGVGNMAEITTRLIDAGKPADTPAAVVADASRPTQRTVTATLENIKDVADAAHVHPPAVLIIGSVVQLRDKIAWFEKLPLFGETIIVTRPKHAAGELAERLVEYGANVIISPTIEISPPEDTAEVDRVLGRLGEFDCVAFTSVNGVAAVFKWLNDNGIDARAFGGMKVAAVGDATANALAKRGLRADLTPENFTTAALGQAMKNASLGKGKVLLARAAEASEELSDILRDAGADVTELAVYRTVCPDKLPEEAADVLRNGMADWITFTSPSTVENFLSLTADAGIEIDQAELAAIGPVTAKALRNHRLRPTVVAQTHTIDGLVSVLIGLK